MANLANLYHHQGQYDRALPLHFKSLEDRKSTLGENHPDTLKAMNTLAVLYYNHGQYDKARPLYEQCLKKRKSTLDETHPATLRSVRRLGQLMLLSSAETDEESSRPPLIRLQVEVQTRFAPLLKKEGNICRKNVTSFVRKGVKGEKIVTTIDGVDETENKVKDDNSWVVCGRAAGEYYVLSGKEFEDCYDEGSAKPIQENSNPTTEWLHQQGFLEYSHKRQVWAQKVDEDDMDFFRYGEKGTTAEAYFVAPWGESMRVEQGDYLVMQYPDGNDEVYRVECAAFGYSYTEQ